MRDAGRHISHLNKRRKVRKEVLRPVTRPPGRRCPPRDIQGSANGGAAGLAVHCDGAGIRAGTAPARRDDSGPHDPAWLAPSKLWKGFGREENQGKREISRAHLGFCRNPEVAR